MNKYLLAAGILISGIVAIASLIYFAPPYQTLSVAISTSRQQQSEFYTSTANQGDITITEILVDTSVQFPPGGLTQFRPPSWFLVVSSVIGIGVIVAGIASSQKVESAFD